MHKAVFLDRDGVLLQVPDLDRNGCRYIYSYDQCIILQGLLKALRALHEKGYLLVVVSNQSVVADGFITSEAVKAIHEALNIDLERHIDSFYFCPHHPALRDDIPAWARQYRTACACRKPAPGMLFSAANDLNIDLSRSWLVGDMISDISAGKTAGCKTVMVPSIDSAKIIRGMTMAQVKAVKPDYYAKDLLDAVKFM